MLRGEPRKAAPRARAPADMISPLELPETFKMAALQIPRRAPAPGRVLAAPAGEPSAVPPIGFPQGPRIRCPPAPTAPCEPPIREISGSCVSLLYLNVALGSGLSLLCLPSAAQTLAWAVCPVWSVAILAHACAGDALLLGCGVALALIYPIVALVRDPQLDAGYLLLFAGFASRGFWRDQRGVWLIGCVICWAGVLAGAAGLLIFRDRPGVLEGASLSALGLAVVCTRRLARFRYKIVAAGGAGP